MIIDEVFVRQKPVSKKMDWFYRGYFLPVKILHAVLSIDLAPLFVTDTGSGMVMRREKNLCPDRFTRVVPLIH